MNQLYIQKHDKYNYKTIYCIFYYSILSFDILAPWYFLFVENLRITTNFFVKMTNVEQDVNTCGRLSQQSQTFMLELQWK